MLRHDFSVLLADRRISRAGKVLDEEYNKICVLFCRHAKLAVAFTGVATVGHFNTADWIASTMSASATEDASISQVLEVLRSSLGPKMLSLGIPDARLTLLFVGYTYWNDVPEPRIYVISNDAGHGAMAMEATLRVVAPAQAHLPLVELAGAAHVVPANTVERLAALLRLDLSPQEVLRFSVAHLQNASRSAAALNSIGEQCNSAILWPIVDTIVTSTYHSARRTNRAYSANVVVAGGFMMIGAQMVSSTSLAGPTIRTKDPCWCGSGVAFGRCHLKKFGSTYSHFPAFKTPLSMIVLEQRESPWPSGRRFCVSSSFV